MGQNFTKLAFTESVKKAQEKYGSRSAYQKMDELAPDKYQLSQRESAFIEQRDGFYLSTVGENGWPYVQFRGGPKGFLKVIDQETLGYADFRGNIYANSKASMILMDYASRSRLKIWANTAIMEPDQNQKLAEKLILPDYAAKIERLVVFHIQAYDWNCPQHITPKFTMEEIKTMFYNDPQLINQMFANES